MTVRGVRLMHVDGDAVEWRADRLAEEEPLELVVDGTLLTVTMRTPGHDFDLAVGFLLAEGVIRAAAEVTSIRTCSGRSTGRHNRLEITLRDDAPGRDALVPRAFTTSSACGVCGSATADAVTRALPWDIAADPVTVRSALLTSLPGRLRAAQRDFDRTGGLHAAALFDPAGELVCVREDVGRHNALDKVIGRAATDRRLPLRGHVVLVSGRASFELIQKAAMAGVPVLAAVSAPSSLAVDLAARAGMTLVGFLRGGTMNVYTGVGRINA